MPLTANQHSFSSMPNFRRVQIETPSFAKNINLYRSSRPDFLTADETEEFNRLGIKSIIDCRSANEYKKADGTKSLDLYYPVSKVNVPLYGRIDNTQNVSHKTIREGTVQTRTKGHHFLINFFKMKYIVAVYNRAPWYVKLYSLLYLLMDFVLWTDYRNFVSVFARNVLNKTGLTGQYMDIIKHSQNQIYVALKLLCSRDNVPAMINCAHGKDRTGIVTAMILACLGQSKEHIAKDYARSEIELEHMRDRLHKEIVQKFDMCPSFTKAPEQAMMDVLNAVESEYGSLTNYLEFIGFTYEDQTNLRENLLS